MANPPKKTVFDLLVRLAPKATPEDELEARRLGVTLDEYRAIKLEVQFGEARKQAEQSRLQAGDTATPPDIAAEEAAAHRLRVDPGLIKPRNTAPNVLVQAAKTPGEVAKLILFVGCYFVGLVGIVVVGGERVQKMPGIFQCVILGLLVIPSLLITDRIWEAIGERARDVIRAMVRFWPLTLIALLFALGLLRMLSQTVRP